MDIFQLSYTNGGNIMDVLEMFDVNYESPILESFDSTTQSLNDVHVFMSRIQMSAYDADGEGRIEYRNLKLYEISSGIFISTDRLDTGASGVEDDHEMVDYYSSARLTREFLGESLDSQKSDYFEGIKKVFSFYKNKCNESRYIKEFFEEIQFRNICGFPKQAGTSSTDIFDQFNSVDVLLQDPVTSVWNKKVGSKKANIVIIPPATNLPITEACATAGFQPEGFPKLGSGSFFTVQFDPFFSTRFKAHETDDVALLDPTLTLLHEMTHGLHFQKGIANPVNRSGETPAWATTWGRVTGDNDAFKETPMEELLTFNKHTIDDDIEISDHLKSTYIGFLYNGRNEDDPTESVDGVYQNVSSFLNQYRGFEISSDFQHFIESCYGVKYNQESKKFIVNPRNIKRYVQDGFFIDEAKFARILNIKTRSYYTLMPDNLGVWSYRVDILNRLRETFDEDRGLLSQELDFHTALTPVVSENPALELEVAGMQRMVSLPKIKASYLPSDIKIKNFTGQKISHDTILDTNISGIIISKIKYKSDFVVDESMPRSSLNTTNYNLSPIKGTKFETDIRDKTSVKVTVSEITAPMINHVMKLDNSKVLTERPSLNEDLEETFKNTKDVYIPKTTAMMKLKEGADQTLGAVGFAVWSGQILEDLYNLAQKKEVSIDQIKDDLMSILPFYCAYKNLSAEKYEQAFANATLDAFLIFATDGGGFAGLGITVGAIAINSMYAKAETMEAYDSMFGKYVDQYQNDIKNFTLNAYVQWENNILSRLWNESRLAITGFRNMLKTVKTVMEFDATNQAYSEEDRKIIKAKCEEIFSEFPMLMQTFAKNSMTANLENASKIFNDIVWQKIKEELDQYVIDSKKYFLDSLEEAYNNGSISAESYYKYQTEAREKFVSPREVIDLYIAAHDTVVKRKRYIRRYSRKYDLATDFKGNTVHLNGLGEGTQDIQDLYGNYSVYADKKTVSTQEGHFDQTIKIAKDTNTINKVVLAVSSNNGKEYALNKDEQYTISFWLRMPVPSSSEERRIFSYSAVSGVNKEVEELILQVKNNEFVLATANLLRNSEFVIEPRIALNRWVKITIVNENTRIKVYQNDNLLGLIKDSSRKKPIAQRGTFKFYNYNVDYQLDDISYYNGTISQRDIKYTFKEDHGQFVYDHWGERLQYNKAYYLLSDDNKSAFETVYETKRLKLKSVPGVDIKYLGMNDRVYGYYGGLQFKLVPLDSKNMNNYVRWGDKFTMQSIETTNLSLAIIQDNAYFAPTQLKLISNEGKSEEEIFTFDRNIKLQNAAILVGTGNSKQGPISAYKRGYSGDLWINGARLDGYVTVVNKSNYSNDEIQEKFKWIFVPKDANWVE